jgi:hypothetical protein
VGPAFGDWELGERGTREEDNYSGLAVGKLGSWVFPEVIDGFDWCTLEEDMGCRAEVAWIAACGERWELS